MSKEYVWPLKIEDEEHNWSCVVEEDECITYEDGVERERLPISNLKKRKGVMQIDTKVSVFGGSCEFKLQRGVPYLMVGGKWCCSVTTNEERMIKNIRSGKQTAIAQIVISVAIVLYCLFVVLSGDELGTWIIAPVVAVVAIANGINQYREVSKIEKEVKKIAEEGNE